MARSRLHQELSESESEYTRLLLSLGERSLPARLEKKKAAAEQSNMPLSPRPGSSAGRIPSRRLSGSFSNTSFANRSILGSPSSRRSSLGSQQPGWSSFNPQTQGAPPMKKGTKSMRQMYAQSEFGSHPRDETASVVSTVSGPLSADI